jgi:hypothetical protein
MISLRVFLLRSAGRRATSSRMSMNLWRILLRFRNSGHCATSSSRVLRYCSRQSTRCFVTPRALVRMVCAVATHRPLRTPLPRGCARVAISLASCLPSCPGHWPCSNALHCLFCEKLPHGCGRASGAYVWRHVASTMTLWSNEQPELRAMLPQRHVSLSAICAAR